MFREHRTLAGVATILVALVVTAVVADVALWVFARLPSPFAELQRLHPQVNQYVRIEYPRDYTAKTIPEEGLPGMTRGPNRFTTNNMGFRGGPLVRPKPAGEFRIFLVGGSTTECFYIDDDKELGAVLQRALNETAPAGTRVAVYNVGLSGAASDDHVAMIDQRLVHLQPDMIVVFSGINDLLRSMHGWDYLHYLPYEPVPRMAWYKRLILMSQIARRLYYFKHNIVMSESERQQQRPLRSDYAAKIGLERTIPPTDSVPRTDVPSYATNLETLVGVSEAQGFQLVFMTQQTTWNSAVDPEAKRWQWMRLCNGVTYREDRMDAALESLNDAMRRVAGERGVPLYDLARELPKSLEYFYDDCHFNDRGAATTAQALATFLRARALLPTTSR
jgi:lysophospholipase L1-like esterase